MERILKVGRVTLEKMLEAHNIHPVLGTKKYSQAALSLLGEIVQTGGVPKNNEGRND